MSEWSFAPARAFSELAGDWDRLNGEGADTSLLDSAFVGLLIREFARGEELIAVWRDGGAPRAILLVERGRYGRWHGFQPSQAPVGLAVADPDVDLPGLLFDLVRALPGFGLSVGLLQQDPGVRPRPDNGGTIRTHDYIETARIRLAGDFDSYWKTCDKKMRKNIQWRRNRLSRQDLQTRLEILTRREDMGGAVEDFGRLESSGWKGREGTAVHHLNAQGRFYQALMESMSTKGEAIVYRYWIGESLVASDLCVHRGGSLIVLKIAYDETARQHAPNILMREAAMRAIFESGDFHTIEFYGRVKEWHTKWTQDFRTLYHISCFRWPIIATARDFLRRRKGGQAA